MCFHEVCSMCKALFPFLTLENLCKGSSKKYLYLHTLNNAHSAHSERDAYYACHTYHTLAQACTFSHRTKEVLLHPKLLPCKGFLVVNKIKGCAMRCSSSAMRLETLLHRSLVFTRQRYYPSLARNRREC